MLSKSKRIISMMLIAISLVCCLGMFTACKKKKSKGEEDNTTPPTVQSVTLTADMVRLEYETVVYDRTEKEPTVTVKYGNTVIDSTEYVVSYSDNKDVGTATATVAAAEESTVLKGSVTKEFEITVAALPAIRQMSDVLYSGSSNVPNVYISGLHNGTDYVCTWEYKHNGESDDEYVELKTELNNFVEVGYYRVTATGMGNYEGTRTAVFAIYEPLGTVETTTEYVNYNGNKQVPEIVVRNSDDDVLQRGIDYEVSYEYMENGSSKFYSYNLTEEDAKSFISAGQYRINVTGKGLYGGTKSVIYRINALVVPMVVFESNSGVYTGTSLGVPNYSVGTLVEGTDYEVSWQYREFGGTYSEYPLSTNLSRNFVNAGEYRIIVQGKGNYILTKDATYTINRADLNITATRDNYTYNANNGSAFVSGNSERGAVSYYITNDTSITSDYENEGWKIYNPKDEIDAGTYYLFAKVSATTNYNAAQSEVISFEVYRDELYGLPDLTNIEVVYNGKNQCPDIVITSQNHDEPLEEGKDYRFEWMIGANSYTPSADENENFIDPGVYIVYLYAKGNYTISDTDAIRVSTYFQIWQAELDDFYLTRASYTYGSEPTEIKIGNGNGVNGVVTLGATITYYYKITGTNNEYKVFTEDTVLDAGRYSIYAIADDVRGYDGPLSTAVANFEVFKATPSNITLTFETANDFSTKQLTGYVAETYNGTVTYYYNQTGATNAGTEITSDDVFATLDAGTYYVYAKITGMTNYNDYTTNVVSLVVPEAAE